VWLSFDDGCKELLENVLPLVRQRKIPVTLFIPSGIVEGDGLFPWLHGMTSTEMRDRNASARKSGRDSMTVAKMRQVAGWPEVTIGSHTVSHAVMTSLKEEKARFELGESKRTLESWTGADVKCFAFPEGRFDGRDYALEGVDVANTAPSGTTDVAQRHRRRQAHAHRASQQNARHAKIEKNCLLFGRKSAVGFPGQGTERSRQRKTLTANQ